jgi:hypothetical protein
MAETCPQPLPSLVFVRPGCCGEELGKIVGRAVGVLKARPVSHALIRSNTVEMS